MQRVKQRRRREAKWASDQAYLRRTFRRHPNASWTGFPLLVVTLSPKVHPLASQSTFLLSLLCDPKMDADLPSVLGSVPRKNGLCFY